MQPYSGVVASTTQNDPIQNEIRDALVSAYSHDFNVGKVPDPFVIEAQVLAITSWLGDFLDRHLDRRAEVYDAIDTERDYQEAGFGNAGDGITGGPHRLTPGENLLCQLQLINQAIQLDYRIGTKREVAEIVRKIAAVAVQYMENYGAWPREFTPYQKSVLVDKAKGKAVENTKS